MKTQKQGEDFRTEAGQEIKGKDAEMESRTSVPVVYCGPSIKGVARQYTVYANELPEQLKALMERIPAARGLVVRVDDFARTRKNLEIPGTAEAILYEAVQKGI